jgi:hypothetical protein
MATRPYDGFESMGRGRRNRLNGGLHSREPRVGWTHRGSAKRVRQPDGLITRLVNSVIAIVVAVIAWLRSVAVTA